MPPPQNLPPAYYRDFEFSPFSSAPPPMPMPFGLSQNDLAGMGAGGAALQTLAPVLSEFARNRFGAFGFTFGSGINPATTEYGRDFLRQMNAGRAAGAAADQASLNDLLRGMAVVIGHTPDMAATRAANDGRVRFDAAGERMISRLAADGSAMLPFLAAMMPDAVDAALPGGSRTVAAGQFTAANRFLRDPVTGGRLSDDAGFTNRVLDPLIAAGPRATDGLRAGRVGAAYAELSRRGLIGPGDDLSGAVARREAFDAGVGPAGVLGQDAPGMSRTDATRISADRVRRQLEGYSKTVAAINEIFAENGQANAPMAELIRGLEGLTQGGLTTYGSAQLTGILRTYQGAGQEFGLTLQGMQALSGSAGAQLAAVGGNRGLAAPAALFAAAAGNAYGARGFAVGPETGGQNDQMAMTMARTTAFAGSEMANLMGALEVQSRYLGPDGANTDLGRVVAGLKAGQTRVGLADGSTFDFQTATQAQITGLAERSGLSGQSVLNQIAFGGAQNRAAAVANQPGFDTARQTLQRGEAERAFLAQFGGQVDRALGGRATSRQFLDAVYTAANQNDVTTLDEAVRRAGSQFGLDPKQVAQLGPLLDAVGTQWARTAGVGDVSGLAAVRNMSPQFQANAADALGRARTAGERAAALAQTNPQGIGAAASDAVARAGRLADQGGFVRPDGTLDWQKMIASGALGMVSEEDATRALGQRGSGFSGGVGGVTDAATRNAPGPGPGRTPQSPGPGGVNRPPPPPPAPLRVTGEIIINDNGVRRPATIRMTGDQAVPPGGP